jgi:hypothetical protein
MVLSANSGKVGTKCNKRGKSFVEMLLFKKEGVSKVKCHFENLTD